MNKRGIEKIIKKDLRYYLTFTNITYFVLVILCFVFFAFYGKVTNRIFAENKIDVFQEDLEEIAFYFRGIDPGLSDTILKGNVLLEEYQAGENIFLTQESELTTVWEYIKKNRYYLQKLGFAQYEELFALLNDLWGQRKEIFTLLGRDEPLNYLVILQNRNEKRPNGGFFGSFGFMTIDQGHVTTLEVVDSYYPDFIAYQTFLRTPPWSQAFLPDRKIGFLTSNKFGFTDIDGKNIKDLYEKMFGQTYVMRKVQKTMEPGLYEKLLHKNIKGVIFVRTDLFEEILPGFREKVWERQFTNASVDMIRGELAGNKKELYIQEMKQYINDNKIDLIRNFVNHFGDITEKRLFNVYLSNVSDELNTILKEHKLSNVFDTGHIYAWDTNSSYNKVDGFVMKQITIEDRDGNLIVNNDHDIVDISKLSTRSYTMEINYTLDVPQEYYEYIKFLEEKYEITLTDREKGILAMQPTKKYLNHEVQKWWESKSTIYFPPHIQINGVEGDMYSYDMFEAPFAHGLYYVIGTNDNKSSRKVVVNFEVK